MPCYGAINIVPINRKKKAKKVSTSMLALIRRSKP